MTNPSRDHADKSDASREAQRPAGSTALRSALTALAFLVATLGACIVGPKQDDPLTGDSGSTDRADTGTGGGDTDAGFNGEVGAISGDANVDTSPTATPGTDAAPPPCTPPSDGGSDAEVGAEAGASDAPCSSPGDGGEDASDAPAADGAIDDSALDASGGD